MKFLFPSKTIPVLIAVAWQLNSVRAEDVLLDPMDYANGAAFKENWGTMEARGDFAEIRQGDPEIPHAPYVFLRNSLIHRNLDRSLGKEDWTLKFKVLHSEPMRGIWVGLFNDSGTAGYAVLWDSGNSGEGYNGTVSIRKFDDTQPLAEWSQTGIPLAPAVKGVHSITELPFAEMELSWKHESGLLTVVMDGIELQSVAAPSLAEVSQVIVRANWQSLDDIQVSTP